MRSLSLAEDELNQLKTRLQGFFADGLVVVVGSGLSLAEGIPGMGALAVHLKETMAKRDLGTDQATWKTVDGALDSGVGLEAALQSTTVSDSLDELIRRSSAELIQTKERKVLEEIFSGARQLRFGRLLPHLNPNPGRALPVITTNYDRLLEFAAEIAGFGVNNLFVGNYLGIFDPELSRRQFIKSFTRSKQSIRAIYRPRIDVYKPHGSLGWYELAGKPVQCNIPLDAAQFIITPGLTKYRRGYDRPFDKHRDEANKEIDRASRYLVIGYGFNDDHLETHLESQIHIGKPCLLLTHGLSENAARIIKKAPNMVALSHAEGGFAMTDSSSFREFKGAPLWDVESFVDEVLSA